MSDLFDELTTAIAKEDFETARLAVELGADVNGIGGFLCTTPLSRAITWGLETDEAASRRVQWLLQAGARVAAEASVRNDEGTSMHEAAARGWVETLKLLLAADGSCALEVFDFLSRTPLVCAVANGHLAAAKLLIDQGANVNAHDEARAGNSALSYAVEEKNEEMAKLLLSHGADPLLPGWMQLSAFDRVSRWRESRHPELRRIFELLARASNRG